MILESLASSTPFLCVVLWLFMGGIALARLSAVEDMEKHGHIAVWLCLLLAPFALGFSFWPYFKGTK